MDQRIIELYDEYTHAPLDRRDFLERLTAMLGSAAAVPAVLAALEPRAAAAATVGPEDPRLTVRRISYQGAWGEVSGYRAEPAGTGATLPGVIVIHENRGLNAHIEDVARRLALAGFVTLAPDLLSLMGGTPPDPDRARAMIGQLDRESVVGDLVAAMSHLRTAGRTTDAVGAVGFCWGGGMVNQLAVAAPDLGAGVVYYGPSPDTASVARIKAPMLLHYAGLDPRVNDGVPAYREALRQAGVRFEAFTYEGANHAFNNDTSAERYDEQAAALAWERTVRFLKAALGR